MCVCRPRPTFSPLEITLFLPAVRHRRALHPRLQPDRLYDLLLSGGGAGHGPCRRACHVHQIAEPRHDQVRPWPGSATPSAVNAHRPPSLPSDSLCPPLCAGTTTSKTFAKNMTYPRKTLCPSVCPSGTKRAPVSRLCCHLQGNWSAGSRGPGAEERTRCRKRRQAHQRRRRQPEAGVRKRSHLTPLLHHVEFKTRLEPLIGLAMALEPPVKDEPLEVRCQANGTGSRCCSSVSILP